jgi:hypothetical protein
MDNLTSRIEIRPLYHDEIDAAIKFVAATFHEGEPLTRSFNTPSEHVYRGIF